ncbi:sulfatase-like hydrolase/transferase [Candidatus Fermentibacteria bacterium]|nr:sulfatase-like hydrolase/transferase [Candidatus Fermentibacteria bacterium]
MFAVHSSPGLRLARGLAIALVLCALACAKAQPKFQVSLSSWPQTVLSAVEEHGFRMGREDERFLGRGWGTVEQDPDGRFFRWAVGDTVELRIPLVNLRDLVLRLRWAPPPTATAEHQGFIVFANGVELARFSMTSRRYHWFEVSVPRDRLRRGWNTIGLVPSMRTPPDIDPRPLRFALREASWDVPSAKEPGIGELERALVRSSANAGIRVLSPRQALRYGIYLPSGSVVQMTYGVQGGEADVCLSAERFSGGDETIWSGRVSAGPHAAVVKAPVRQDCRAITVTVGPESRGIVAISDMTAEVTAPRAEGELVLMISVDGLTSEILRQHGASLPALYGGDEGRVSFLHAYTPSTAVAPCYASVMTSFYPFVHGVVSDGIQGLSDAAPTLASILASQGFGCVAVVSDPFLAPQVGRLARGFTSYAAPSSHRWSAQEVADEAIRVVCGAWPTLRPGFLWLHFSDPAALAEDASEGAVSAEAYRVAVALVDSCLGEVLRCVNEFGVGREPIQVTLAGRGMAFGAQDARRLSHPLAQPLIQVPLLLRGPEISAASATVIYPVSLLDIMPTVLAMAEIQPPAGIQGTSLLPLMAGGERWSTLFSEAPGGKIIATVRLPLKLVHAADTENPPPEMSDAMLLFDLANDPAETLNVLANNVSKATDMIGAWHEAVGTTVTRFRPEEIREVVP